ncbi:hypothetical protein GCM10010275_40330 [Streptomyces litmocidini]|nr:hypothetical protein GCM10010275_40330 [Streptomyces litmocidini]
MPGGLQGGDREVLQRAVERLGLRVGADVRARTHGRKTYRHPLVGLLELHHENFAPPDGAGMELAVLSATPGTPAEDGLRLLAGLDADSAPTRPPVDVRVHDRSSDGARPRVGAPPRGRSAARAHAGSE